MANMHPPSHLIISQIKNIGDVVLCIPTAGLIKHYFPNCKVSLLAHQYTHPVAACSPHFDTLLNWTELEKKSDSELIQSVKSLNADGIIHLSIDKRIARLAKKAQIPYRIGTSQRLFHWLYCNKRINQARRHSRLHELQLNAEMLKPLGIEAFQDKNALLDYMALTPPAISLPDDVEALLASPHYKFIIHPGSNGHGREWPQTHFVELAKDLQDSPIDLFFTGTAKEAERFAGLIKQCPHVNNVMGKMSLSQLLAFIGRCDGLIASGTGPVHLAAALNKQTIGLFPPRKGISPRRWSPPGRQVEVLMHKRKKACLACTESEGCLCMSKISVAQVKHIISSWLTHRKKMA